MTRAVGFWAGWVLLGSTLLPLFVGDLRMFEDTWIALTMGVVFLGFAGLERSVGRSFRPTPRPWLDTLFVLLFTGGLFGQWGWFYWVDLRFTDFFWLVLGAVAGGALALPVARIAGAWSPQWPYWAGLAGLMSIVSALLAVWVGAWDRPNVLLAIAASAAGLYVPMAVVLGVVGAVVPASRPAHAPWPLRIFQTALAGAIVGLAHAHAWSWVRFEGVSWAASEAYRMTLFISVALIYPLGPYVLERLLAPARPDPRLALLDELEAEDAAEEQALAASLPAKS